MQSNFRGSFMKLKFLQSLFTVVLFSVSFMSNATLILQGGTGSTGAGNISLDSGTVIDVSHSAYYNGATSPASSWVWASGVDQNADLSFTFTFSLDGFDISTASLSGLWGVDNVGSVYLNNTLLSDLPNVVTGNFNVLTAFNAGPGSSAFVAGTNTLTFDVGNRGGPGAFRASVEVSAQQSNAAQISEPNALILFMLGLPMVLVARRIRNK